MHKTASALNDVVRAALPKLIAMSDEDAGRPRAPGKWSRKQIVGHLIDSASNNHQRFVRAQLTDDLVCPTYDQEAWVELQEYDKSSWIELVTLWHQFNLHLAHVMQACPTDVLVRERQRHNLDRVAFRAVPANEPVTLEYFMYDYVAHLEHHLAQIFDRVETI